MIEIIQRREARTNVDWIALIRLADGTEVPCTVKDVSTSGMKVAVPETLTLPETFTLKVLGRDLVFRVKIAWRRQHSVGVVIEKIAKLPRPQEAANPPEPKAAGTSDHTRIGSRERYRANA